MILGRERVLAKFAVCLRTNICLAKYVLLRFCFLLVFKNCCVNFAKHFSDLINVFAATHLQA